MVTSAVSTTGAGGRDGRLGYLSNKEEGKIHQFRRNARKKKGKPAVRHAGDILGATTYLTRGKVGGLNLAHGEPSKQESYRYNDGAPSQDSSANGSALARASPGKGKRAFQTGPLLKGGNPPGLAVLIVGTGGKGGGQAHQEKIKDLSSCWSGRGR